MSQEFMILQHMRAEPITPIDALRDYGCFRLAARIKDLRDMGYDIETDIIEKGGKRFAQYRLIR